ARALARCRGPPRDARRGLRRDDASGGGRRPRRAVPQRGDGPRHRRGNGTGNPGRGDRGRRDSRRRYRRRERAPGRARGRRRPRRGADRARTRRGAARKARRGRAGAGRIGLGGGGGREAPGGLRGAGPRQGASVMRIIAITCIAALTYVAGGAEGLERLAAVLHVHSDLSTGDFPLEQRTAMAEKQGIGALLLTENYLLRVEYGLPPFRALTRAVRDERSVVDLGIDRYLERVAQARSANPRVLIVPGVEVLPHYHWTGSPFALEMAVHGTQKNLLLFGLDAAGLRALPVTGNRIGGFGWSSVLDALPILLVVPGVYLLGRTRRGLRRVGRAVVVVTQRRWVAGAVLCAIAALALVRGWPFTEEPYPPYRDLGLAPHQDLIDYVDRLGGLSVWSFPEARDAGQQWMGPVKVSWYTPPYPDDLLRTARYTAFGAVYEDTTRVDRPGESWDRLLGQFATGDRSRPAWAVGESGFHGFSAGKTLGKVRTVFLVEERT